MTASRRYRALTRADILPLPAYEAVRAQKKAEVRAEKRNRQIGVGPHATFTFESFNSMWVQVHEMLRTENGGGAQIDDELAAYAQLVPQGRELVATLMFEIENAEVRARQLAQLGGVEETVRLRIDAEIVAGVPERDTARTNEEGKTSAVHFLHFPFTEAQIQTMRANNANVTLEFTHPRYRHAAGLPEEMRRTLAADFDEQRAH